MIRTNMRESAEATISRLLSGLNREIADHVEMFPYNTLQDLVHQAMCHAPTLSQARDNRRVNPSGVINTFLELALGFHTPVHTYNSPITGEYHKN